MWAPERHEEKLSSSQHALPRVSERQEGVAGEVVTPLRQVTLKGGVRRGEVDGIEEGEVLGREEHPPRRYNNSPTWFSPQNEGTKTHRNYLTLMVNPIAKE